MTIVFQPKLHEVLYIHCNDLDQSGLHKQVQRVPRLSKQI